MARAWNPWLGLLAGCLEPLLDTPFIPYRRSLMDKLEDMLREVRQDRKMYVEKRLWIDAAACAIREKALEDARDAFEDHLWNMRDG